MDVLDEALLDADSEVREAGFRALTALPELSALQKLYLVAALQDREIRAACSACEAARVFLQRGSLSTHIPSILASAYYGAMSEAPELRFGVARVVDAIVSSGVPPEVGGLCRRTIRLLKSDAHYSIRSVFSRLECGDCSETENMTV